MKHLVHALLGATLLAGPLAAQDKDLLIGSTSASSSHYGYFVAVGQLINDKAEGLRASVVETGATMDNIRRMERGQVDLGLVTTNVAQHATAGTNEFEGRAQDLTLLWVYTGAPQNVVMRADAGVTDLAGLDGVRFNPGIKGSATESTTEAVFETLARRCRYGFIQSASTPQKVYRLTKGVRSGVEHEMCHPSKHLGCHDLLRPRFLSLRLRPDCHPLHSGLPLPIAHEANGTMDRKMPMLANHAGVESGLQRTGKHHRRSGRVEGLGKAVEVEGQPQLALELQGELDVHRSAGIGLAGVTNDAPLTRSDGLGEASQELGRGSVWQLPARRQNQPRHLGSQDELRDGQHHPLHMEHVPGVHRFGGGGTVTSQSGA